MENIPFIDPARVFSIFNDYKYPFFLDSGMSKYGLGQYSFIGFDPFLMFKSKGKDVEIFAKDSRKGDPCDRKFYGDPFFVLRHIIDQYKLPILPDLPSFLGGGVGYFSYEMKNLIEKLPAKAMDDIDIPDCIVCLYDVIIIFDHKHRQAYISSSGFPEQGRLRQKRAINRIKWVKNRLKETGSRKQGSGVRGQGSGIKPTESITSNLTHEEYIQAVIKAKEYIAAGDIYQVNLSQRLMTSITVPPFELYQQLRRINPAPFGSYLDFGEVVIAGSSPERFLSVEGKMVETRPIKGTRPRGRNMIEDKRLGQELLLSEKDRAELMMIVDLLRNDLGRVCKYGSVVVKNIRKLEAYSTVFHTVATICGELSLRHNRFDLLKACFPGGSITGAPKIRAMEIIDELEPNKRHIYTGCIGYLSFSGSMDMNIAIRTFLIKGNQAYFHVGGGIVADSSPEDEYMETLHKGKALIKAVEMAYESEQFR
ncbi:aminodeoxychorismate synthase component I [Candidatus Desantisbacteria bacterium]|nr:aminodeoxychorismate synthase component I [Candidatus Desantisbacteria bacterium]